MQHCEGDNFGESGRDREISRAALDINSQLPRSTFSDKRC